MDPNAMQGGQQQMSAQMAAQNMGPPGVYG